MQHDESNRLHSGIGLYNWNSPYRWGDWGEYAFEFAATNWDLFEGDAGAFAFVKQSGERDGTPTWKFIYAGSSENFSQDVPNHPKWAEAHALGATHVIIKVLPEEERDGAWERHWIRRHEPPLNPPSNFRAECEEHFRTEYEKRYGRKYAP